MSANAGELTEAVRYFARTAGNVPAARFARVLIEKMPGLDALDGAVPAPSPGRPD